MFSVLRILGSEFGGRFREYFTRDGFAERIQGVHLRFDPYWSEWFRRWQLWHWEPGGFGWLPQHLPPLGELLKFRPPGWTEHCKNRGYPADANPVVWLVVLRTPEASGEGQLPAVFESAYGNFPIRYEHRAPAMALHAAGDAVGVAGPPPTRGTLGGVLEDSFSRQRYLVTCAHVCPAGPVFAHSGAARGVTIGNVVHSVLPPVRTGLGCNRHTHFPPPNLDLAVVKVTSADQVSSSIPTVGQPQALSVTMMNSHDPVVLYGARSKRVEAELDSVGLYHEVIINSKPHCFGDIFSFTPRRPWYVNTQLVRPGDSGAWVTRKTGALLTWDGMLIAGDGAHAYACFSDNILRAAQNQISTLVLP